MIYIDFINSIWLFKSRISINIWVCLGWSLVVQKLNLYHYFLVENKSYFKELIVIVVSTSIPLKQHQSTIIVANVLNIGSIIAIWRQLIRFPQTKNKLFLFFLMFVLLKKNAFAILFPSAVNIEYIPSGDLMAFNSIPRN